MPEGNSPLDIFEGVIFDTPGIDTERPLEMVWGQGCQVPAGELQRISFPGRPETASYGEIVPYRPTRVITVRGICVGSKQARTEQMQAGCEGNVMLSVNDPRLDDLVPEPTNGRFRSNDWLLKLSGAT